MFEFTSIISTTPYILVIPLYIFLSPLCIISHSLFDAALGLTFDIDQQTTILIIIVLLIWIISIASVLQLIKNRTYKAIFFYQFVFFLTCFNFILIGISYSLLRRNNIIQEMLSKISTTLIMIYAAQKMKIRSDQNGSNSCKICFVETTHNDCIILRCKHFFHEKCLWDWLYVKSQCPVCSKPFKQ